MIYKNKLWFSSIFVAFLLISPVSANSQSLDIGIEADKTGDYRSLILLAEQGDAAAQYNLALLYSRGEGVTQNHSEAATWYRKAAEQGDAAAEFALASMHRGGEGVPQDFSEAVKWYRSAAEQGHADAQHNLALMYYNGEGVSRNLVMAYMLAILAAAQSNENAVKARDVILEELAHEQIAEAQKLAAEWSVGTSLPVTR